MVSLRMVKKAAVLLDKAGAVPRLLIDEVCRHVVEEACILKEAIDHATDRAGKVPLAAWMLSALQRVGLEAEDLRGMPRAARGKSASSFVDLLLGQAASNGGQREPTFTGLADVPEWCVVGWVRHEHHRGTIHLGKAELQAKASELSSDSPNISTVGQEGVPLLWALEGQNRTALFRLAGVPRRSTLTLYGAPDVSDCVARPLARMPGITVVRWGRHTELLPFGDLSRRLLETMGVRWSTVPSVGGWLTYIRWCRSEKWSIETAWTVARSEKGMRLALLGGIELAGLDD